MIVIATNDDRRNAGADELTKELEDYTFRVWRRRDRVEDITGDQGAIDRLALRDVGHFRERRGVLFIALAAAQTLADVPIRRVQKSHRDLGLVTETAWDFHGLGHLLAPRCPRRERELE